MNRFINRRYILPLAIGGSVLLTVPLYSGPYYTHIAILVLLNVVLALSYRVFFVAGVGSFGHIAFYGIGAYTSAILATKLGLPFPACFAAGGAAAAILAIGLGLTGRYTKGLYFFIMSFAFYEIMFTVWKQWESVTEGPGGIRSIPPPAAVFASVSNYYYLVLAFTAVSIFIMYRLDRSRFGVELRAIGDADDLAEMAGIDVVRYKIIALAIGALFAGFAGSMFAHYIGFIAPASFGLWLNLYVLIWVIIGGAGKLWGPIAGAAMMTLIAEQLRASGQLQAVIYGAVLLTIILVMPNGIVGLVDTWRAKRALKVSAGSVNSERLRLVNRFLGRG